MLNGKLTFSLIDRVQEMTLLHTLAIQLDISEACSCSFLTNLYAMDLGVMLLLLYTFSILGQVWTAVTNPPYLNLTKDGAYKRRP